MLQGVSGVRGGPCFTEYIVKTFKYVGVYLNPTHVRNPERCGKKNKVEPEQWLEWQGRWWGGAKTKGIVGDQHWTSRGKNYLSVQKRERTAHFSWCGSHTKLRRKEQRVVGREGKRNRGISSPAKIPSGRTTISLLRPRVLGWT